MHSLEFMMVCKFFLRARAHFQFAHEQSDMYDLRMVFVFFFAGHGGSEAATFAKEHLINLIVNQKAFWSDDDQEVLRAIREGYLATHYAMWREQGNTAFFRLSQQANALKEQVNTRHLNVGEFQVKCFN